MEARSRVTLENRQPVKLAPESFAPRNDTSRRCESRKSRLEAVTPANRTESQSASVKLEPSSPEVFDRSRSLRVVLSQRDALRQAPPKPDFSISTPVKSHFSSPA